MANKDIVVIGASAGGIESLQIVMQMLPPGFPAATFVVVHVPPHSADNLAPTLDRASPLLVAVAKDGAHSHHGHVYLAPPDRHLLVEDGVLRVISGAKENRHRPAVDPLFRSAARTYGNRVVAVVLSGSQLDGAAGLQAVKNAGGTTIVQNPEQALFPGMPRHAIEAVEVDHILPLEEIAPLLVKLTQRDAATDRVTPPVVSETPARPIAVSEIRDVAFSCPECHGVLLPDENDVHFRCRVGHAFGAEALAHEQHEQIEQALWAALNVLEENETLTSRIVQREQQHGRTRNAETFEEMRRSSAKRAEFIRTVLGAARER